MKEITMREAFWSTMIHFFVLALSFSLVLAPVVSAQEAAPSQPVPQAAQPAADVPPPPPPPPSPALGSRGPGDAYSVAMMDAEIDTNRFLWFGAGCLLGWVGILLGYVIEPSPPVARLVGQSPDYVMAYSAAYKEQARKIQGKQAMVGCAVNGAVIMVYYLAVVLAYY